MRGIGVKQAELEYTVLGSMLMLDRCLTYGAAFLNEDVFLVKEHQEIFSVLKTYSEQGGSVESGLVEEFFKKAFKDRKPKEREGLENKLLLLVEYAVDNFELFANYCEELVKRYEKRRIGEIAKKLSDGEISEEEAAEELLKKTTAPNVISQENALLNFLKLYEEEDPFPFVPAYHHEFDLKVRFEHITVVAARPGIGKTVFALAMAKRQAENGHPVLFFSQELPVKDDIIPRLIAMELGVSLESIKGQFASLSQVVEATGRIEKLPIRYIDGKITVPQFAAIVHAHREWLTEGEKRGIIYIDYLQFFKPHKNGMTQKDKIDYAMDVCVELTKELRVPIVMLAQINRQVATGKKIRPTMDHLKGSGDIEQSATNVLILHRDLENSPDALEVFIDKSRLKGRSRLVIPFIKGFPDLDGRFVKEVSTEPEPEIQGFEDIEF